MTLHARLAATACLIAASSGLACAPSASALPPGFPDLNTFTPVAVDGYFVTLRADTAPLLDFSTPYNVVCNFYGGEKPVTGPSQGIECNGELPGMDRIPFSDGSFTTRSGLCNTAVARPNGASYEFHRNAYGGCEGGQHPTLPYGGPLLGVGQKISYQNVTCAVGADQLIACLDTTSGEHGFLLKPSGSVAF